MRTNSNDQAFPTEDGAGGLTKREYFAGLALQGLVANSKLTMGETTTVKTAIKLADDLINKLNRE